MLNTRWAYVYEHVLLGRPVKGQIGHDLKTVKFAVSGIFSKKLWQYFVDLIHQQQTFSGVGGCAGV